MGSASNTVAMIDGLKNDNQIIQMLGSLEESMSKVDSYTRSLVGSDRLDSIITKRELKVAMVAAMFSDKTNSTLGHGMGFKGISYSSNGTVAGLEGYIMEQTKALAYVIFNGAADYLNRIIPVSAYPGDRYEIVMDGRADIAEHMTTIKIAREQSLANSRQLSFTDTYLFDGQKILVDESLKTAGKIGNVEDGRMGEFFQYAFSSTSFLICALSDCNNNAARQLEQASVKAELNVSFETCLKALLGTAQPPHPWNPNNKKILDNQASQTLCYEKFLTQPVGQRAYIADSTALAGKVFAPPTGQAFVMFPDSPISREPLAAFCPSGSPRLLCVMNWTQRALVMAAHYGLTRANIASKLQSDDLDSVEKDFFINNAAMNEIVGNPAIFKQLIESHGNYSEMWNRADTGLSAVGISLTGANKSSGDGGAIFLAPASQQ